MKKTTTSILLLAALSICSSQGKYAKLTLSENGPGLKSPEVHKQVEANCNALGSETVWNEQLSKCNTDQCKIYDDYSLFSSEHLKWIDDVRIESQYDQTAGMEVEIIRFYSEGKEVAPKSFFATRIEQCKGDGTKQSLTGCTRYIMDLALKSKSMVESAKSLQESSQKTMTTMQSELSKEIEDLKGSRSPADMKKAKEKKEQLGSVKHSSENTAILLPDLIRSMNQDYSKISGVSKTIKKLEKGL